MSTRASAAHAIASALTGTALALTLAAPMAHADPEVDAVVIVDRDKYGRGCQPLIRSPILEARAQAVATTHIPSAAFGPGYNGRIRVFTGQGDPQAVAINRAYRAGAGNTVGDCAWTEYGTGFDRLGETDFVAILFGKPAAPS